MDPATTQSGHEHAARRRERTAQVIAKEPPDAVDTHQGFASRYRSCAACPCFVKRDTAIPSNEANFPSPSKLRSQAITPSAKSPPASSNARPACTRGRLAHDISCIQERPDRRRSIGPAQDPDQLAQSLLAHSHHVGRFQPSSATAFSACRISFL